MWKEEGRGWARERYAVSDQNGLWYTYSCILWKHCDQKRWREVADVHKFQHLRWTTDEATPGHLPSLCWQLALDMSSPLVMKPNQQPFWLLECYGKSTAVAKQKGEPAVSWMNTRLSAWIYIGDVKHMISLVACEMTLAYWWGKTIELMDTVDQHNRPIIAEMSLCRSR